jgi:hypothetical protein
MQIAFEATINFYSHTVTNEPRETYNRQILLFSDIANTDMNNMYSVFYIAKDSEGGQLDLQKLQGSYDCDVYVANDAYRISSVTLPEIGDTFNLYNGKFGDRNKVVAQGTVTAVLL